MGAWDDRVQQILDGREWEGGRLLIVDDEDSVVQVLNRALDDPDLSIQTAQEGRCALDLVRNQGFDLILTDIVMPGASGIAILKEAKARNPETEVILMTGYASVGSAAEALRLGAADYLLKPFDNLQTVRFAVKRALTRRSLVHLARQYSSKLQETNHQLHAAQERYGHLAEIMYVSLSRTIKFLDSLAAAQETMSEGLRVEMDALRESQTEMTEIVDQFLNGETTGEEAPPENLRPGRSFPSA